MPLVYLVRHAETVWNTEKRMQGHLDSPLSALGREQSRWLGRRFAAIPIAAAYVSDLGRAGETFTIMYEQAGAPQVHFCEELREIALGSWEGRSITELAAEEPEAFDHFRHHPELDARPDGESFPDVIHRVGSFFEKLLARHPEEDILVLTHGVAMTAILHCIEARPLAAFWKDGSIPSTAVALIEHHKGKARIKAPPDTSHYVGQHAPVSWFDE